MTMSEQKMTFNIGNDSAKQLNDLAETLSTTPAGVISQAVALFIRAQGRQVIIKDKHKDKELIINTFVDKPAQKDLG